MYWLNLTIYLYTLQIENQYTDRYRKNSSSCYNIDSCSSKTMVVYYFNRLYGTIRTVFYTATRGHEKEVILLCTNWWFTTKRTNRTLKAAELY